MKTTVLIVLCFSLFASSYAQCDSTFTMPIAEGIRTAALFDTNRIIAAGLYGNVIKSTNAGKSWRAVNTPTKATLSVMQFPTDSTGYIAGDGVILKTEDQGESWVSLYGKTTNWLNGLYFFDKDNGFIVGNDGLLLATKDGGRNWKDTILNFSNNLSDITFLNDSTGFVCGTSGICYKTSNKGLSWQSITLPTSLTCTKVKFINDTTGFIIGYNGLFLKTTNSGSSWTQVNIGTTEGMLDIFFADQQTWLMASSSSVFKSTNGGSSWTKVLSLPFYELIWDIASDPQRKKIVFGGATYYNNRIIFSTSDNGNTYNYLCQNTDQDINDIFCLNDAVVFAAASNGIFMKSGDYGQSWTKLQNIPGSLNGQTPESRKIIFLDSLNGFAYSNTLYRTADGGKSWIQKTTPGGSAFNVTAVYFSDTTKGLAQNSNYIYKTFNGGNSWQKVATSPNFYMDLAVTPSGKAFAIGYNGSVQVSTDTGTTWTPYNLHTTKFLTSIYFYNNTIGFIGTADSSIFKTTDGGLTWSQISINVNQLQVKSFLFLNEAEGYMTRATGSSSTYLYKTKNGGLDWYPVYTFDVYLAKIRGINKPYFAGYHGHLFSTDSLQIPAMPGYIQGPSTACVGFKSNYFTGTVSGATYNWSISGGGTQYTGANRDTVLWNTPGQYTISLSVSNACGISPARQLVVNAINFTPVITIADSIFTATEGLFYQWYRNNIPISAAQGGNARSIRPVLTGSYTVMVYSFYGCSVLSSSAIYNAPVTRSLCPGGNVSFNSNIVTNTYQWQQDDGTGYQNITNNIYFSGTNSIALYITGAPSSWYGYKFRCLAGYLASDAFTLQFKNEWTGTADNTWENPANWNCGVIPDMYTDVIINNGTLVINSNVTINSLTLKPGANLTVMPGFTLTVLH